MGKEYTRLLTIVPAAGPTPGSVFFEDFSNILRFTKVSTGGDEIFELDPTISMLGPQSLHMKTRTTGSAANDIISALILHHLTPTNFVTFTSIFQLPDVTRIKILRFTLKLIDGVNLIEGIITFTPATPKWEYDNVGGVPTLIANSGFSIRASCWHRFTLTVNFDTNLYISCYIDQIPLPIPNFPLHFAANGVLLSLSTSIDVQAIDANPAEIYIDSINIFS